MIGQPMHLSRSRPGFTLIEVLLAIGLLLALVGSMFAFLRGLVTARERALEFAATQLGASVLIDRLESDLMYALVGDSRSGAGVAGDESGIRVLSRAVNAQLADRGLADARVLGDLQRSEYRFRASEQLVEARRFNVDLSGGRGERFWPVAHIAKIRFRYHDGTIWRDSFDSLAAGRLPQAIEVGIWFDPWPGEEAEDEPEEPEFERLTFDMNDDVFDENEFADMTMFDLLPPPPPDRVRIIVIPDAGAEEDESIEFAERTEDAT